MIKKNYYISVLYKTSLYSNLYTVSNHAILHALALYIPTDAVNDMSADIRGSWKISFLQSWFFFFTRKTGVVCRSKLSRMLDKNSPGKMDYIVLICSDMEITDY